MRHKYCQELLIYAKWLMVLVLTSLMLVTTSTCATSITQIPRNTKFFLNQAIDIPANHTTLFLGGSGFYTFINSIAKVENQSSNNYYYYQGYYWQPRYNYYRYDYFMEPGSFWQPTLCAYRETHTLISTQASASNKMINK